MLRKRQETPEPEAEPEAKPESEPEPPIDATRRAEIASINALLRTALVEMHARAEAQRECSRCLDNVIDRVVAEEERRVAEATRADVERNCVITEIVALIEPL